MVSRVRRRAAASQILAFDVGGSFVKAARVDPARGVLLDDVVRVPTPAGASPAAVIDLLADIAGRMPSTGPFGLAFPTVARQGVAMTAANIDRRWIGTDARALLSARIRRPVAFLNDADAAGLAEMRMGAGRGRGGTVLVVTLGTGIGSALFADGRLVPNTELGHLQVGSEEAEQRASARVRVERGLSWQEWAAEVNVVLAEMHRLLWPDLFIIGGGVTENWDQFGSLLSSSAEIVVARHGNDAGLIGAAMAAVELKESGPRRRQTRGRVAAGTRSKRRRLPVRRR
jgi:polyphosphate glucokinase